ncbi:hypothetical protein [Nocardia caishijiensis]|uniref:Uncharacterized protein n=1 Tax=Nocardia caishijiensis TaxID=184756 RepID=A0ABQ6YE63_9NOCA|nr:hypothetical protein [Nocardia caishijiensis]KAF0835710.1 hypothetical protein FNL39_11912 [Nocardia caishijiensis]
MSDQRDGSRDTDWLPTELDPVAFRLARADHAIEQIAVLCAAWSQHGVTPAQIERSEGTVDVEIEAIRPIPPAIAMLFSEAINHMRSAIENTLFYVVESAHEGQLTEKQARCIQMPIKDDQAAMDKWHRENGKIVSEFAAGAAIGKRVASLQPFNDPARIPSIGEDLAELMGVTPDFENPLKLMQEYSNTDKHRGIRLCLAKMIVDREDQPFIGQDHTMRPVCVGDRVMQIPVGVPIIASFTAIIGVERPSGAAFVSPAAELNRLLRHVCDVVIPMLVKGIVLTRSLPPHIDLGDTGQSSRKRLQSGGWEYAHAREGARMMEKFVETVSAPPKFVKMQTEDAR